MIHEDEDPVIDFSWYWYIGLKMGLTIKETGRMSLRMFMKLYQHYKDIFDLEMRLKNANVTYAEAYIEQQKSEEWF